MGRIWFRISRAIRMVQCLINAPWLHGSKMEGLLESLAQKGPDSPDKVEGRGGSIVGRLL